MLNLLSIAVGGAVGALLRYAMSSGVHLWLGRDFPYGTLFVNVLGSLLMGLLYVVLIERTGAAEVWRAGLIVGLLGAFTTFSTFSIESLTLVENGEPLKAGVNILASVSLCILGGWIGIVAARQI